MDEDVKKVVELSEHVATGVLALVRQGRIDDAQVVMDALFAKIERCVENLSPEQQRECKVALDALVNRFKADAARAGK